MVCELQVFKDMSWIFQKMIILLQTLLFGLFLTGCLQGFEATQSSNNSSQSDTDVQEREIVNEGDSSDATEHALIDSVPSSDTRDEEQPPNEEPTPSDESMMNIFMAAGHMGRTVISCDDGRTWIRDQSVDDDARCWIDRNDPNYVECDHTPHSGTGLDYGDGWFFISTGWGHNGFVKRSRDGIQWETIHQGDWGGGLAYYDGQLSLMWGRYRHWSNSLDMGQTWQEYQRPEPMGSHEFVHRINDKFFSLGRGPGLAVSHDQGSTWQVAENFLPELGGYFVEADGKMISVGMLRDRGGNTTTGYSAISVDDGVTWVGQEIFHHSGDGRFSGLIHDGHQFIAWYRNEVWTSVDGIDWNFQSNVNLSETIVPNFRGPVSYNPETGQYVAIPNNWGQYYDRQRALYSLDGIQWQEADQFQGGHPIRRIVRARVPQSFCD